MLFTKIFWGGLIVLFGLSIIINAVFKINFPFFKVFISLVIIYIGFKMLFGGFGFKMNQSGEENSTVFGSSKIQVEKIEGDLEYNSVFGSQVIDFRKVNQVVTESEIEISAVFGSIKVFLPENVTIKMKASSAFGSVRSPNGEVISFGEAKKTIATGEVSDKTIYLEVNAVFGSVDLR
jgi:predicted membrane protein